MKTYLKKLLFLCLAGLFIAGLTITASAIAVDKVTTNNEIAGNEAALCIDGDDTRIWHTDWINGPFDPPFILTFELDDVYEISSIGLYPRQDGNLNGLPYVLNINVSDDGENFRTVEEVDWLEYTYDLQTIELSNPVTTKYLQLEILETEGQNFASLNQLYINDEAVTFSERVLAEKQAKIDAMLAANGFKSIVADNEHGDYLAVYAGDGDNSKFWHTDWNNPNVAPPISITFELDNLYSVTELTLTDRPMLDNTYNGAFIDFNIYSSLDGENFTLVKTITGHNNHAEPQTVVLDQPVITRYIRLEGTTTIGNYGSLNQLDYVGTVVDEAALDTKAPSSNIAVDKVTTNNEIAGNEAALCIDGDDTRIWHTDWINGPFDPPFILTFELDDVYEISSIGLYPRQDGNLNGLPYVLNINVSDDGENFRTVEEVDWLEYTYDLQTIELSNPVTTKYLQLEILETEGQNFASLNQLYINDEAVTFSERVLAEKQAKIDAMLAANGFKSIVADNEHGDYLAVYAGDGDNSKFWHTDWNNPNVAPPISITFELDNLYSVTELTLTDRPMLDNTYNGAFIDFNIYSSLDGENFTLVKTITGHNNHAEPQTVVLDQPVITRYIRLEGTTTIGNYGSLNQLDYVGTVVDEAAAEPEAPAAEPEAPAAEPEAPAAEPEAPAAEPEAPAAEPDVPEAQEEPVPEAVEVPTAPNTSDSALLLLLAVIFFFGLALLSRRQRA